MEIKLDIGCVRDLCNYSATIMGAQKDARNFTKGMIVDSHATVFNTVATVS